MFRLKATINNSENFKAEVSFWWEILDTPPAMMWLKLMLHLARSGKKIFPRFTGFISPYKKMSHLRDDLNSCIDVINSDQQYIITARATEFFDQDFSNIIHHHFEVLSGSFENPSDYYKSSNAAVRKAIAGLNQIIHDMESLHRANETRQVGGSSTGALICEIVGAPRYKIPEEYLNYFTMNIGFGDIFLHYSQIGKTWWEVFNDGDQEIYPNAILPLSVISGEFDAFFYHYQPEKKLIARFNNFLIQHGKDPKDKRLALGFLPVAKLINEPFLSHAEIHRLIGEHLCLKEVLIYRDDVLLGTIAADYAAYDFLCGVGK